MRNVIVFVLLAFALIEPNGLSRASVLGELVDLTSEACSHAEQLLTDGFTNRISELRASSSSELERGAADLALAISLYYRLDHDESAIGNEAILARHQTITSNLCYSIGQSTSDWIKYQSGFQYVCGLNYSGMDAEGFAASTNILERIRRERPVFEGTNFWSSYVKCTCGTNLSIQEAFRLNAALSLAHAGRMAEVAPYTNDLSAAAMDLFARDLE